MFGVLIGLFALRVDGRLLICGYSGRKCQQDVVFFKPKCELCAVFSGAVMTQQHEALKISPLHFFFFFFFWSMQMSHSCSGYLFKYLQDSWVAEIYFLDTKDRKKNLPSNWGRKQNNAGNKGLDLK